MRPALRAFSHAFRIMPSGEIEPHRDAIGSGGFPSPKGYRAGARADVEESTPGCDACVVDQEIPKRRVPVFRVQGDHEVVEVGKEIVVRAP